MNNIFSKLFMAFVCLLSVSIAAHAQDGALYKVSFTSSAQDEGVYQGSQGAYVTITLNENTSRTHELRVPYGTETAEYLICIGGECEGDYDIKGGSGSILDIGYFQGLGSTEDTRSIVVEDPFGYAVYTSMMPIELTLTDTERLKLTSFNDCGFWGDDDDDFAANQINPQKDDQVITGILQDDCRVDLTGQRILLSKPKLCSQDVDKFPYMLSISSNLILSDETQGALQGSGISDSIKYIADIVDGEVQLMRDPSGSLADFLPEPVEVYEGVCAITIPDLMGVFSEDYPLLGEYDLKVDYKDANDVVTSVDRKIYFTAEGSGQATVTNDMVEFALDTASNCEYVVDLDDFTEGDFACEGEEELYEILIYDKFGCELTEGTGVIASDIIAGTRNESGCYSYPLEGEQMTVYIKYLPTGRVAWTKLKFKDAQAPSLHVKDGEIVCTHPLVDKIINGDREDFTTETVEYDGDNVTIPPMSSATIQIAYAPECVYDGDYLRLAIASIESNNPDSVEITSVEDSVLVSALTDGTIDVEVENHATTEVEITAAEVELTLTYDFNDCQRIMATLHDVEDCFPESITLESSSVRYNCPDANDVWVGAIVTRTWKACDATGKCTTQTQRIRIIAPTFDEIIMPTDEVKLGCEYGEDDADLSPEALFDDGFDNAIPRLDCGPLNRESDKNLCSVVWTYEDTELPGCGPNGKKIIRTWTILNWCTKQTYPEFHQTLAVQDNEGPEIVDYDISFGSEPYDCSGEVRIDLDLEDDCSGVSSVIVEYSADAVVSHKGGGPINGSKEAEEGETIVISGLPLNAPVDLTIRVIDACGNETEHQTTVTTQDHSAPICKVDDQHNVVVGSDGRGFVYAKDIDEGTEDNCGVKTIEVRREGGDWGPYVEYKCSDIVDGKLKIEFRAEDYAGNECTTWMEVLVEDGISPTVRAPRNNSVRCDDPIAINAKNYLEDRNGDGVVNGHDYFEDNCVGTTIIESDYNEHFDNCGGGYATLRVVGRDASSKTREVVYVDTLFLTPFNDWKVTFPADRIVEGCNSSVMNERPVIENNGCSRVIVSTKTDTLKAVNGGCYKVHRVFTVINTCVYDPANTNEPDEDLGERMYKDGGDGYIKYTQVIEVTDNVDPTVGIHVSDEYCINDGCDTDVTISVNADDDCATIQRISYHLTKVGDDSFDDESDYVVGNNNITFEALEEGTYEITASTSDNCGNTASVTETFVVRDCKRPTPVCFSQLNAPLMILGDNGMVDIWASDFLFYAFDNCTDSAYLVENAIFEWGSTPIAGTEIIEDLRGRDRAGLRVTREALNGNCDVEVEINVVVRDRAGNSNFCTAIFLVQDNECQGVASGNIAGSISTFDGDMVEDANVSIAGSNSIIPTATNGTFNFSNLEAGKSYVVEAEKLDGLTNGVNTQDILIIVRHLLSEKELDTPYDHIAADVNRDGRVSPVDLVSLRKAILRDINEFPNNTSWRFVDKSYEFSNTNPLTQEFNEVVEIKSLDANSQANFYGIKVGDVNGSAIANSGQVQPRTAKTLTLGVDDMQLKAGEVYTVSVKAEEAAVLSGYQFTMNFSDAVEFQGANSSTIELNDNNFGYGSLNMGIITTAWDDVKGVELNANDELFNITLKANKNARLSEVFAVNSRLTPAAGFVGTEKVEAANIELAYNNAAAETVLYQNTPNPFADETTISFNLGQAGEAVITVFDMAGRIITRVEGDYAAGVNKVTLNKGQLNATGVLYYQLETNNFSATKKMVVLK